MDRRNPWVMRFRLGAVLLSALILMIQVSISNMGNAFLICMGSVAVFMSMTNRLTNHYDAGSRKIPILFALFSLAFSMLFVNEIRPYLGPGFFQSGLIILALVSGICGAVLSLRRSDYRRSD